jgi:hypothetical protein
MPDLRGRARSASGLVIGRIYHLRGPLTLLGVPVAAAASVLALSHTVPWIWVGVAIWGVVNGVLDSTVKAIVTKLVPSTSRAVAFGWLAASSGREPTDPQTAILPAARGQRIRSFAAGDSVLTDTPIRVVTLRSATCPLS